MNGKKLAGENAANLVRDGMTVGLGTGSTVYYTIQKLAERIVNEGLRITGVATSKHTERLAQDLGIPLVALADVDFIDITIDGADEVTPTLDLVKGGGGALFREKLVAVQSKRLVVVADQVKRVNKLGAFPVPIEVVPFAWEIIMRGLLHLGAKPKLRMLVDEPYVTDNGNYILDASFEQIDNPQELEQHLKLMNGVVESGLFVGIADTAFIGSNDNVIVLNNVNNSKGR
ncbi:ribose-5-phosphate isomerase RpiA [Paenibacillus taichungensis]|uniref:ribose-5-phosphate isomerase RpiA n=1 Tax=Paenibacillus taichungensis TaxID=484184 RepID=UPI002871D407|nr:ribose-5-phosphate isomerase RpiA [Paenibacillus taichungensis]MDR9748550.1 ribose-5-phosphate isomerase RpiA [Paenibacillus taichungensis]